MPTDSSKIPYCPAADPAPYAPGFEIPPGAVDTHAHVFGPETKYPYSAGRGYTPPDASLDEFLNLHKVLGIERACTNATQCLWNGQFCHSRRRFCDGLIDFLPLQVWVKT